MQFTGKLENVFSHDCIALAGGDPATVEHDAAGVPAAWRLFRVGENRITKDGVEYMLTLSAEDLQSIVDHHAAKGEKIPIDSEHFLKMLAEEKNLEEAEVLRLNPRGVAALGFGSLQLRRDELWLSDIAWGPTAYELMKEKIYRYFSPVIRGMLKPPLRVTSVAMENEPALCRLDMLAAAGEKKYQPSGLPDNNPRRSVQMDKLTAALAKLLGRDSLALAEGDNAEVAEAVVAKADLLAELRQALALPENITDTAILAALKAIVEKAGGYDQLKAQLDEMTLSAETAKREQTLAAETAKREQLIAGAIADKKFTNQMAEWAKTQNSLILADLIPTLPVIGAFQELPGGAGEVNTVALSETEKAVARKTGISEADMLETKKKTTQK